MKRERETQREREWIFAYEFKRRRRGGGSERRDFVNVFFGARRYIGGREWWYAVPDAFLDAFRSTPSFYIYTFILFFMKNNQTLFKIDFWTTLLRRASSPRRRVESSSSTLYIYIYRERETPATFARFAYIIIIIIIIIVSSKPRAALRRWTSTCPNRRRLVL